VMSELMACYLCDAECDIDDWCFGCRHFICDDHPETLVGGHDPREHDGEGEEIPGW